MITGEGRLWEIKVQRQPTNQISGKAASFINPFFVRHTVVLYKGADRLMLELRTFVILIWIFF